MGCCNERSVALLPGAQSPALHVNYAKGMVLGVDDFTQEFTYLSGRDRWMAAELIGYGTTSGLAVVVEDAGTDGVRVRVASGAAVVPSGKLVCVPSEQCALINKWLAKPDNTQTIDQLTSASPPGSPPSGKTTITLYLTLCYADCLTALVPIPGEPCRSEDELMAPSRVADDYKLELRAEAPPQTEEDAVRDFVAWLKQVPIVDGSPPQPCDEAAWIAALRAAAQPWFDAVNASPPMSPPASFATLHDYLFGTPSGLSIPRECLCDFLRVAFRFWVTELRPLWMTRTCGGTPKAGDDCVLLARLDVPIVWIGGSPSGAWEVDGSAAQIVVDESRRPYLAHLRLLQEWLTCGCSCGDDGSSAAPAPAVLPPPANGAVPVGNGSQWIGKTLAGKANQVIVTQQATSVAFSLPQDIAPASTPSFAGLTTTGAVHIAVTPIKSPAPGTQFKLDATHHLVICSGSPDIMLPKCDAKNLGRVYIVKSIGKSSLVCDPSDGIAIKGGPLTALTIVDMNAVTVVSDGQQTWHVVATVV